MFGHVDVNVSKILQVLRQGAKSMVRLAFVSCVADENVEMYAAHCEVAVDNVFKMFQEWKNEAAIVG